MTLKPIQLPDRRPGVQARGRHIGARFGVQAADGRAEITIYDEIGYFGVSASAVRRTLDGIDAKEILVRINSPGGDVFDGIAIYNDLLAHPAKVSVEVTGIAASAASIIAMAGDTIGMGENTFLMIHNAWGLAIGNKADMRAFADVLDRIDGALAQTYATRTGQDVADIAKMMDEETWMGAAEAVDKGFATAVLAADPNAKALFDLSVFAHVPGALKGGMERDLRSLGYSQTEAKAAVTKGFEALPQRDVVAAEHQRDVDDLASIAASGMLMAKFHMATRDYRRA